METLEKIEMDPQQKGWHAKLSLEFKPGQERTILGKVRRSGPLTVQQPFYPEEGPCHLYLLHPPGGLVGGDCLELEVQVRSLSHGFITTPGATKFYRSSGRTAFQKQTFFIEEKALLEYFPQETILFDKAFAKIETIINLAPRANFMGWDILCLGLPAIQERFETGRLFSSLALYRDGAPLLLDRLNVHGKNDLDGCAGLRGCPVSACFIATGVGKILFEELQKIVQPGKELFGITLLDELLVARYLGSNPWQARSFFLKLWKHIRPRLINKKACIPRIWNT